MHHTALARLKVLPRYQHSWDPFFEHNAAQVFLFEESDKFTRVFPYFCTPKLIILQIENRKIRLSTKGVKSQMIEYFVSADLRLLEVVYISLRSITSSVFTSWIRAAPIAFLLASVSTIKGVWIHPEVLRVLEHVSETFFQFLKLSLLLASPVERIDQTKLFKKTVLSAI